MYPSKTLSLQIDPGLAKFTNHKMFIWCLPCAFDPRYSFRPRIDCHQWHWSSIWHASVARAEINCYNPESQDEKGGRGRTSVRKYVAQCSSGVHISYQPARGWNASRIHSCPARDLSEGCRTPVVVQFFSAIFLAVTNGNSSLFSGIFFYGSDQPIRIKQDSGWLSISFYKLFLFALWVKNGGTKICS